MIASWRKQNIKQDIAPPTVAIVQAAEGKTDLVYFTLSVVVGIKNKRIKNGRKRMKSLRTGGPSQTHPGAMWYQISLS